MNSKILVSVVVSVAALGALVWFAQSTSTPVNEQRAQVNSALAAEETSYDFGTISMAEGPVRHTFTIRNSQSAPFRVAKLYTSCMCTTALLSLGGRQFGPYGMPGHGGIGGIGAELAPDETASIEVVFDPAAHGPAGVGKIERVVVVEGESVAPFELRFSAVVTP